MPRDPDTLTVYDSKGNPRTLVRLSSVSVPVGDEDEDDFDDEAPILVRGRDRVRGMDRTGALVTVEHTLDPKAMEVIQSLRKGAPVAAMVGGVVAGAALMFVILWFLDNQRPASRRR
jgi:hypothetical protein